MARTGKVKQGSINPYWMTLDVAIEFCHLNNLLTIFPAKFLANPVPINALLAIFDAWLNLSHLEKASVFVIVRINAIAILAKRQHSFPSPFSLHSSFSRAHNQKKLTHDNQPDGIQQPHQRQHRQSHPQRRRNVHAQPEESSVRRIDHARPGLGGFKYPV